MSSIWKNIALGIGAIGASAVSAVVAAKTADKVSDYREKQRREKLDEEFDELRKKTNPTSTELLEYQPSTDNVFSKVVEDELDKVLKTYQQDRINDRNRVFHSDSYSNADDIQCETVEKGKQENGKAPQDGAGQG